MKKFLVLLKKEIKEMLNLQVLAPLLLTVVLFAVIGNVIGKEEKKSEQPKTITVVDEDQTIMAGDLINVLKKSNLNVVTIQTRKALFDQSKLDSTIKDAQNNKESAVIIIPEDFQTGIVNLKPEKIELYSLVRNFSLTGLKDFASISAGINAVNEAISSEIIVNKTAADPTYIKNPVQTNNFVVVGDKKANTTPDQVMNFIQSQTMFIPIILFIVIVFASQMIATTIAQEKENKTLETLLTTPVSRKYIVVAKMAGAGIVALIASGIYMFGMRYYLNGLTGMSGGAQTDNIGEIVKQLGLVMAPSSYALLGLSLFFGILAALSISLILGAFAEDVKSVAGLTSPLMVLVGIPYFISMFLDLNSASPALRYLVYAIPFSHPFLAAPNLFLHNFAPVIYGIIYQAIFFMVFVFIASKIFSTDKIITMKLNFSKKRKLFSK